MAMRPTAEDLANDAAADAAAMRPGVLIGSAHASRSVTGGRITEEQRKSILRRATEALEFLTSQADERKNQRV